MRNLTDFEVAQLRIKCVEVFVVIASRFDLEKSRVFELGEQLWKFATNTLEERKNPASKQASV